MASERSHNTGHHVRSKVATGGKTRKEAVPGVVHHTLRPIEPGKLLQTTCLRTGRFVQNDKQDKVAIIQEDRAAGKLLRVSEYRTLTTCKHCNGSRTG